MLFTCRKCNTRVEGETIFVFGFHYHPNCFVCFDCGKNLSDVYFEINKLPYCELDYKKPRPGDPTNQPTFKKKPISKPAAQIKQPRTFSGSSSSNNNNNSDTNKNNNVIIKSNSNNNLNPFSSNNNNNLKKSTSDTSISSSSDNNDFMVNIPKSGSSSSINKGLTDTSSNENSNNSSLKHSSNELIKNGADEIPPSNEKKPDSETIHIHHHHHHQLGLNEEDENLPQKQEQSITVNNPVEAHMSVTSSQQPYQVSSASNAPDNKNNVSSSAKQLERQRSTSFDNSLDDILNSMEFLVSKPKNESEPKNITQLSKNINNDNNYISSSNYTNDNNNNTLNNNNNNNNNNPSLNKNNDNNNNKPSETPQTKEVHHHHHHYHSTKPSLASYPSSSYMTLSPNNNNESEPPVVIGDHRSASPRNNNSNNSQTKLSINNSINNNNSNSNVSNSNNNHDSSSDSESDISVHDSSSSSDDSDHESKRRKRRELRKQKKKNSNNENGNNNSLNTSNNSNSTSEKKKSIQLDVDFTFGKKDNCEKSNSDTIHSSDQDHSTSGLNLQVDLHFGSTKDITHVDSCQKNIEELISNEPIIVNTAQIHHPHLESEHSSAKGQDIYHDKQDNPDHSQQHSEPHAHQHSPSQPHAHVHIHHDNNTTHQHSHSQPVSHAKPNEFNANIENIENSNTSGGLRQYSKAYVTNDPNYDSKPVQHQQVHIGHPNDKVSTRTITTIHSSGMRCKTCKLEIFGTTLINHLNESYHPQCFGCSLCKTIINEPYFTDQKTNEFYCAKCQIILNDREKKNRDSLGFCNSCFKFLSESDNVIIIEKEKYHNNCFKCSVCKELIKGPNFSREIMTSTSSNYCCNTCLYSGRVDKCPFCNGVVLGNSMFVPNMGSFHPKCFKCSSCQVVIKHSTPFTIGKNNKPTCQQCSNSNVGSASR